MEGPRIDFVFEGYVKFGTTFLPGMNAEGPGSMELPFELQMQETSPVIRFGDHIGADKKEGIEEIVKKEKRIMLPAWRKLPIERGDRIQVYAMAAPEAPGYSGHIVHHVDVFKQGAPPEYPEARYFTADKNVRQY